MVSGEERVGGNPRSRASCSAGRWWHVELPTTIVVLRLSDYLLFAIISQHGQGQPPALPALVPPALWHIFPEPAAPTFHSPQATSLL